MVHKARRRMLTLMYAAADASHKQGCMYHILINLSVLLSVTQF